MTLGMTTNERINAGRYKHFKQGNPFHRGPLQNVVDFCECNLCGFKAQPVSDWFTTYDLKLLLEKKAATSQKIKPEFV